MGVVVQEGLSRAPSTYSGLHLPQSPPELPRSLEEDLSNLRGEAVGSWGQREAESTWVVSGSLDKCGIRVTYLR